MPSPFVDEEKTRSYEVMDDWRFDLYCHSAGFLHYEFSQGLNNTKYKVLESSSSVEVGSSGLRHHDLVCDRWSCHRVKFGRVSHYKCLGLYINKSLNFGAHVMKLTAKIRSGVALLYRLRYLGSTLYHSERQLTLH